jgi:transcription antitermination factor NusG
VSGVIQHCSSLGGQYLPSEASNEHLCWYAIHTRPRHEKKIEARLRQCGFSTFLPIVKNVHRWTDRRKVIETPLFPCYAFIYVVCSPEIRLTVLRTDGVIGFVGVRGAATPIPETEIESVRILVSRNIPFAAHPFVKTGQRIRIRGGSLEGVEGVVVSVNGSRKLVVSMELIQRSIALSIEGYDIETI